MVIIFRLSINAKHKFFNFIFSYLPLHFSNAKNIAFLSKCEVQLSFSSLFPYNQKLLSNAKKCSAIVTELIEKIKDNYRVTIIVGMTEKFWFQASSFKRIKERIFRIF